MFIVHIFSADCREHEQVCNLQTSNMTQSTTRLWLADRQCSVLVVLPNGRHLFFKFAEYRWHSCAAVTGFLAAAFSEAGFPAE